MLDILFQEGTKRTLSTSSLILPENCKGAVVLDATASASPVYDIFDRAKVWQTPPGSRSYENVTLHVSTGHRVGKRYLTNNAIELSASLIGDLNERLAGKRNVLMVCHKGVEPVINGYETTFHMHTGHWGMIEGSNEWKDCDSVVIFGLPYRPNTWTSSTFMGFCGPPANEWFQSSAKRSFGRHGDIRKALQDGQMLVQVTQAINRVRCRKVIDEAGNCESTNVFILLPGNELSDHLIAGLNAQMPGIRIEEWDYGHQKRQPKRSDGESALATYMGNMAPGERKHRREIQDTLGIPIATMNRLWKKLKTDGTPLNQAASDANIRVEERREGKTKRSYLLRD